MAGSLFSPSWYRVSGLKPRLRSHTRIHRHRYRGQIWYVLQDRSTERFHRFSPAGYFVIGIMDGRQTVQEVWEIAASRLGDDSPTQDEMIHLLSQLHAADVLQCDVPPDTAELLERHERQERRKWQSKVFSPLAWRIPLFDPERFLQRFLPLVQPIFGWAGVLLWLGIVGPAFVLAAVHWTDLTHNVMDRVLAPQNLVLLWLLFPIIKALHELGHAFLTKKFGGEVHDMGIMILVLTPIPYVDASAAWAFREKWRRSAVGAAGMIVELFIAALALYVWLNVEPGTVRTLAYNTMLIGGVSTLLFNGNPLLRFDGYYILADLIEIPNLRARSNAYIGYLCERYLFGRSETEAPFMAPGERGWFVTYPVAAFIYRALILVGIIIFIAGKFFFVGVILAAMAVIMWMVVPAAKGVAFLFTSPRIRSVRVRAIGVTVIILALILGMVCLVPMPFRTQAEGIIWIPDESFVRAGSDGFIEQVVAEPGSRVHQGDILIVSQDPILYSDVRVLEARLKELEARYDEQRLEDLVEAQRIEEELRYSQERLVRARERVTELVVRSGTDGTFVVPLAENLPGRFIRQGELLAHVINLDTITIRTVVSQENIDLIRYRTERIDIRLAERVAETIPATLRRIIPGATERLPSAALGYQGGGQIATDSTDTQGVTSIQKLFELDLDLPSRGGVVNVGGRVYVRFDHGWEPLVKQWYRRIRQLFLSRFNV